MDAEFRSGECVVYNARSKMPKTIQVGAMPLSSTGACLPISTALGCIVLWISNCTVRLIECLLFTYDNMAGTAGQLVLTHCAALSMLLCIAHCIWSFGVSLWSHLQIASSSIIGQLSCTPDEHDERGDVGLSSLMAIGAYPREECLPVITCLNQRTAASG